MAQKHVTTEGTLIVPGAYADVRVQQNPAGLATTGVVVLVGEADAGDHYSDEVSLRDNAFGPGQYTAMKAKYKSGPLVDAFVGLTNASNDPNIIGAVNRVIVVKTNSGVKASGTLPAIGGGTYCNVLAKAAGKLGNLISRTLTEETGEELPTTGDSIICPPQVSTVVAFRANGGAEVSTTISASDTPDTIVSAINGLSGVAATGGVDRAILGGVAGSVAITVDSGFQVHFTLTGTTLDNVPEVGDILYVPTGSPLNAAAEGTYVVTNATTTRIDAYKLLDAAGTGDDLTPPTTQAAQAIAATTDLQAFSPVVITLEAGVVVPGLGKSLEVAESGSNSFGDIAFTFASATSSPPAAPATWVSTSDAPAVIEAAQEYSVSLNAARQADGIDETVTVGGDVVLTLGYKGTTGSAVIADGVLTITVVGGAGASPAAIQLADFDTINDLASYIGSLTGFTAAAATPTLGQESPLTLDEGTYAIGSTMGAATGRIKSDGAEFLSVINAQHPLVDVAAVTPATKLVGLPDVASMAFLTGGSRGATANSDITGALTKMETIRCNFVVTLFSRDASLDVAEGLTDASSSYTIDSINTLLRAHCLKMSKKKARRPRLGFASCRATFKDAKRKAAQLASPRVAMFFQDVRDTNADGDLVQFQPWMAAVKAAGMQAAGFYRPIVAKFVAISGALCALGGFDDQLDDDLEDALTSGLCPIVRDENGGYKWCSDQTTWTRDENFVFNSIQAMYVSDIIATSAAQRMELAFVGQSVADISAALAKTVFEGILADFKRLKLTAASDDGAQKGWKNMSIELTGGAMDINVEVKLAGALYFINIGFLATPVVQTANG